MTPLTYSYLQKQGFKLLIPIVSQKDQPANEALSIWGKEIEDRVIRLEHHSINRADWQGNKKLQPSAKEDAPFNREGLKVFVGEKGSIELQYQGIVFHVEDLEPYLQLS